jgi:osmotically-inducible protein OsmY
MSVGRKVRTVLLADRRLSKSARATLSVVSVWNRVTLRGIVMDRQEKTDIGEKAAEIAGVGNVDNRLTVL